MNKVRKNPSHLKIYLYGNSRFLEDLLFPAFCHNEIIYLQCDYLRALCNGKSLQEIQVSVTSQSVAFWDVFNKKESLRLIIILEEKGEKITLI